MMTAEQLKNSILQLALQGRLVEQSTEDESAQKLLERIRAAKRALIKAGTVPKDKKMEDVSVDNQLFDLPENWIWTRMGELFQHNTGKALNGTNKDGEVLTYITTSNLYWNRFELDNLKSMPFTESEVEKCTVTKGDLLVCEGGDYGRAAIWNYDFDMRIQNHVHRLRAYLPLCTEYYYYVINFLKGTGLIKGKGIAIQGLSSGALHNLAVPLPPLEEQKRIVAKIEELMPFVEQYAKASTRLNTLNASFPEQMKKSILQQAVMGKLVPQDQNDEPASALLKKIAEEKQKLIKEGKIKKSKYDFRVEYKDGKYSCVSPKSISVIDDLIFDIPESWSFCTLADLVQFVGGYAYKSNTFVEYSPYQVLRLGNVKNDLIKRDTNPVFIPEELANSTLDFKCEENDILLTMTGTRLKRDYFFTVRVGDNDTNLFVNQRVGCLRPYDGEMSEWLTYILKSNFVLDYIFDFETGTANQGNLGAENIMKIIVPLPPKNEQKRIVEKLKEILPLDEVLTSKSKDTK